MTEKGSLIAAILILALILTVVCVLPARPRNRR
jgi:hypothetical protein